MSGKLVRVNLLKLYPKCFTEDSLEEIINTLTPTQQRRIRAYDYEGEIHSGVDDNDYKVGLDNLYKYTFSCSK